MKKKQTAEEKLRAALVPEAEQPYALPKKWCWVRLGSISQESKNKSNNFSIPNLKYVGLENLEKDKGISSISSASNIKSQKNVFQQGDILYGKLRPYLNKHDVAQFSGICSTDIIVLKSLPLCLNLYLNYFFNLNFFISYAVNNSKGINLPRLSPNSLMMAQFPLAPFPEQKRISNIINNLFNKLDEAKEKVEQVLDTFETRKAAILHAAFTGKLTEQWRKERGVGEETWNQIPLKKCGTWSGGGTPSKARPEYWENGKILWVTSKDMKSDLISDTIIHINQIGVDNSSANYIDKPSLLFVTRSGILRHTFPVAMVNGGFTVNQDLKILVPKENLNLKYLFYAVRVRRKTPFLVHLKRPIWDQSKRPIPQLSFL